MKYEFKIQKFKTVIVEAESKELAIMMVFNDIDNITKDMSSCMSNGIEVVDDGTSK